MHTALKLSGRRNQGSHLRTNRSRPGTATIVAASAVVLMAGMIAAPAAAQESGSQLASTQSGSTQHTITLITGDQVGVDADGKAVQIVPAPGRENIPVSADIMQGHTYVIPLDAQRLVDS